jgi:hypothetical protein
MRCLQVRRKPPHRRAAQDNALLEQVRRDVAYRLARGPGMLGHNWLPMVGISRLRANL